jgi:hypothetical protein
MTLKRTTQSISLICSPLIRPWKTNGRIALRNSPTLQPAKYWVNLLKTLEENLSSTSYIANLMPGCRCGKQRRSPELRRGASYRETTRRKREMTTVKLLAEYGTTFLGMNNVLWCSAWHYSLFLCVRQLLFTIYEVSINPLATSSL